MPSCEETETVITWTAADAKATVYTLMPKVARLCRRARAEEIRKNEGMRNGRKEAWTFVLDPACFSIRPRRKASPAQLEAARMAARVAREGRNATAPAVVGDPNQPRGVRRAG